MHRFACIRNASIATLCVASTGSIADSDKGMRKSRPLYCTADDIPLNDSDISTSSGFYIQFDSRTRNPKYVVQRSIHQSNVRNLETAESQVRMNQIRTSDVIRTIIFLRTRCYYVKLDSAYNQEPTH